MSQWLEHDQDVNRDKEKSMEYAPCLYKFCEERDLIIQQSSDFEDKHFNIDFYLDHPSYPRKLSAGFRVIHTWVEDYKYDFGIRFQKPSKHIVEYHNVIEADYCDVYYYGFASKTKPLELEYWSFINMNALRYQLRNGNNIRYKKKEKRNEKGNWTIFYQLNTCYANPKVVLASNFIIPCIKRQDEILTIEEV